MKVMNRNNMVVLALGTSFLLVLSLVVWSVINSTRTSSSLEPSTEMTNWQLVYGL